MNRVGHLLTLILGITLSLITLLLFLNNERQRDELVTLPHSHFQTIEQHGICLEMMARSNIYIH